MPQINAEKHGKWMHVVIKRAHTEFFLRFAMKAAKPSDAPTRFCYHQKENPRYSAQSAPNYKKASHMGGGMVGVTKNASSFWGGAFLFLFPLYGEGFLLASVLRPSEGRYEFLMSCTLASSLS